MISLDVVDEDESGNEVVRWVMHYPVSCLALSYRDELSC